MEPLWETPIPKRANCSVTTATIEVFWRWSSRYLYSDPRCATLSAKERLLSNSTRTADSRSAGDVYASQVAVSDGDASIHSRATDSYFGGCTKARPTLISTAIRIGTRSSLGCRK